MVKNLCGSIKTTCLGIFDEVIIIKANEPALNDRTSL